MQLSQGNEGENDVKLITVCSRGIFAEWDTKDLEVINVTKLDIGTSKIKFCEIREKNAVTYSVENKQFRVFDTEVGRMTRQFLSLTSGLAVRNIAVSEDAKIVTYTQGNTVVIADLG